MFLIRIFPILAADPAVACCCLPHGQCLLKDINRHRVPLFAILSGWFCVAACRSKLVARLRTHRAWAHSISLGCLIVCWPFVPVRGQGVVHPQQTIQLATSPTLTPDGKFLAFTWDGDIWSAAISGGAAQRLTSHPARDGSPCFSPDGKWLAFSSERTGVSQVWLMPAGGGVPKQITYHTEGARLAGWYPDNASVLIEGTRDFATRSATRFYRVTLDGRRPESLLFDAEGMSPSLSPDGTKLLFCRETDDVYRRGYRGSRSSQIWLAENLETSSPKFTQLIARESGARYPLWKADGSGFYYLGDQGETGLFDVWEHRFSGNGETRLTKLEGDPAHDPGISLDGSTMVFRQGFELSAIDLGGGTESGIRQPRRISLQAAGDLLPDYIHRRNLSKTDNLSFTGDGLEIAFAAGGDIWVMDTELREPVAVTQTPDEEREPVFSFDGRALYYIRDSGDAAEIILAERSDPKAYWWRNVAFTHKTLTEDGSDKNDLQVLPGDDRISWVRAPGSLWVAKRDGSEARRLLEFWNQPEYSWSPDGKWIAYAVGDHDFNQDVWIAPAAEQGQAYNVSRHPNDDRNPTWSPDGKFLAYIGERPDKEVDIHYVHLNLADEEKDKRDRTLDAALEKMEKLRKKPTTATRNSEPQAVAPNQAETTKAAGAKAAGTEDSKGGQVASVKSDAVGSDPVVAAPSTSPVPVKESQKSVKIDFADLAERVHRLRLSGTAEGGLFWSHDGKKLAFTRDVRGSKSTYTVSLPDKTTPELLHAKTGAFTRWIARDDTLYWLVEGVPSSLSKGTLTAFPFTARQSYDERAYRRVTFLQIWRKIGAEWYDEALNHLDWNQIRTKYEEAAANAVDQAAFDTTVALMLGELNGSHLSFKSDATTAWRPADGWSETTAHLGVRFDPEFTGPGLRVLSTIPNGPADQVECRLSPGDIILEIDDHPVGPATDLTTVLNMLLPRDVRLTLRATPNQEGLVTDRTLLIRPVSYASIRQLLLKEKVDTTRDMVDRLSGGRLGYVLVPKMDWDEFLQFQDELFACGSGKEGLIIDVRDNTGGFTTDHLLTALVPSEHAITVPRGGGPGYPQDRRVYATWNKPLVVLCNQNSYSNAEIFCHAIKELGRGRLIGVDTAGGVVSAGSARIRDVGTLRIPYRGWYRLSDGADLESNGAKPDVMIWAHPDDTVQNVDRQIDAAVKALLEDVEAAKERQSPELVPSSRRSP
jgi:tricorn protease